MNIAFDAAALLGLDSKNRGIGNYTDSQFRTLLNLDYENHYFFFNVFEDEHYFDCEELKNRLREDDYICTKDRKFIGSSGFSNCYGQLVKSYIEKNQIDVFYITSPFDGSIPVYRKEWMGNAAVVATVYDIIPYIMKKKYFPNEDSFKWYKERVEMLRWMDRILVISQSVKDDLVSYLHFNPDKIDVIWGAPSSMFKKIDIDIETERTLREKFHITDPFIMCTGGDDERKNIAGLIEAYSRISPQLISQFQLVVVCKLQPVSVERYTRLAQEKGVLGRVVLTNFVTNEELVSLYNLADLVAFPSKYEGLGLPVLEAWACGTGVVTSNNSSLGQIAGDAAITVDPDSVSSIAKGLEKALNGNLKLLAKKGGERLPLYTWEQVAKDTLAAIRSAEQVKKREKRDEKKEQNHRIAFFTPLPPLESGISDYSVDIINALAESFDIDIYIDKGYTPKVSFPPNVTVYSHAGYKARRKNYLETVFQVGNSLFHTYMWSYIRDFGGLVVLHDYNLHGVVQVFSLDKPNNQKEYLSLIAEDLSEEQCEKCLQASTSWSMLDAVKQEMEVNGFISNYADKIIVHSDEAKRKLLERNIARDVRRIRHYAKIEPNTDSFAAKSKIGFPGGSIMIGVFGHIHQTKRTIPILQAFAKLSEENEKVELVFCGKLNKNLEVDFHHTVSKLNIGDRVRVTGYVDLNGFLDYMNAADICLNLRWPYNGETSGSMMRLLAKGKCAVVNEIGSFSEIPDDAVVKLPSAEYLTEEQEVAYIYEALQKLCADEDIRKGIGQRARHFAEAELDLKHIAHQYETFIYERNNKLVTEELLSSLQPAIKDLRFNKREVERLAHTLACIKNPELIVL